jgi:hypothetical protein
MIRVIFENIIYPSIKFSQIVIISGTGDITGTYFPKLKKLDLTLGNDNADDPFIMFPGRLNIEFVFPVAENIVGGICSPSVSQASLDYYTVIESIRNNGADISLYKEGQEEVYYAAAFNSEDNGLLQADAEKLDISLMFLDDYTIMQDEMIRPHNLTDEWPAGGYWLAANTLTDLIKSLFTVTERGRIGQSKIDSVEFLTKIRFQKRNADSSYSYVYLQDGQIGLKNYYFYVGSSEVKNEIFKRVLMTFCSYGVIDYNRVLRIYPLWYDGSAAINIKREQIESELQVEYSKKYDGLNVLCPYLTNLDGDNSLEYLYETLPYGKYRYTARDARGRPLDEPVLINLGVTKSIEILTAVGLKDTKSSDGTSVTLIWIDSGEAYKIKAGAVSIIKPDGSTYTEEHSLAEWVGSMFWKIISGKGRRIRCTLPGINYSHSNFFTVEGFSAWFRPIMIFYDYEEDQSKIVLWECPAIDDFSYPTSVSFDRILRAPDWSVTVKKRNSDDVYQYIESDGAGHSTGPNYPFLGNEELVIKIKNVYNCGRSTAVEYDGIQLAVNDYDKKLWRDNWKYVIYIAVGKSKDVEGPASDYPVADDANADWYLLATISDQNITDDTSYYFYEYITNAKKIQTKNPFWIWVGLKSTSAPMFDKIKYLAK